MKANCFKGRHEPIISQALFDRVQDVLRERSYNGQRDRTKLHYLKGTLYCQRCQTAGRTSRILFTETRGRNGQFYGYFFCRSHQLGICDMLFIPVLEVERAVEREYKALRLPAPFIDQMKTALDTTMSRKLEAEKRLDVTLRKQLGKIAAQEERLLDLASDGEIPRERLRSRLNDLKLQRSRIEEDLSRTTQDLAAGANLLQLGTQPLARSMPVLYLRAPDEIRRTINDAFFERFYVDSDGTVAGSDLRRPFDDLRRLASAHDPQSVACAPSAGQAPRRTRSNAALRSRNRPGQIRRSGLANVFWLVFRV